MKLQASLCSAESFFVNQRHINPTMKNRLLIALTALALFASPAFCADEPKTELGERMTEINRAWGALKRQAADATKNADSLAKIATIKAGFEAAAKLSPPVGDVKEYQAEIKTEIANVAKLEDAFKAGKNEEAAALIKAIDDQKSADHKKFRKPAAK